MNNRYKPQTQTSSNPAQYITDPQMLQTIKRCQTKIDNLTDLVLQLLSKTKKQDDNEKQKFQKFKQQAFNWFLNGFDKIKFIKPFKENKLKITQPIQKINGHRHHVVIGSISTGKSSLINYACNLELPVGIGQCRSQATQVALSKDMKLHIWDCPAINDNFSFFQPQALQFFQTADKIFIVFPDSIKSCIEVVAVIAKLKPNSTFMVRTQCDYWRQHHKKTIQDQIETDKNYLQAKLKVKLPVLATSAKMPITFKDNQVFVSLLTQ